MDTTPATLLERLRRPADQEAWARFVRLYTPVLLAWAGRVDQQGQDAADLVQDVFAILLQKLPEFRYDRSQSFRAWLWTILKNRWRETRRRRIPVPLDARSAPLAGLADPAEPPGPDEAEYRRDLVRRVLEMVQGDFSPETWSAWQGYVIDGRPAADLARELGVTPQAIYLAKARVLRRIRQELDGLLD
jgi:RNA polymerase sigma-70 factor (ECF subfamily)